MLLQSLDADSYYGQAQSFFPPLYFYLSFLNFNDLFSYLGFEKYLSMSIMLGRTT